MPSIFSGTVNAVSPRQIDVDTASKTIVAASDSSSTKRVGLIITNLASGTIYLAFGSHSAVVGSGVPILGAGGNWNMEEYTYTNEAVQAIAHSNNSLVAIQEFESL